MVQNGDDMELYDDPFPHCVIDNFLPSHLAEELSKEFIDYNSDNWFVYNNPLEKKKALNNWYYFPKNTYQFFQQLMSPQFVNFLRNVTSCPELTPDGGLHGAGWHIQGNQGKLNVHLDYSIHPKLDLERKINLIYYLTPEWKDEWGGNLEFWSHDEENNSPKQLIKTIQNKFNRLLLFDTTHNSWHGFSKPIECPENVYRKSIAMYYLVPSKENTSRRNRALYSPTEEQKNDPEILKLIQQRTL